MNTVHILFGGQNLGMEKVHPGCGWGAGLNNDRKETPWQKT
jgi:hypothetical protein